jgi:hypothetical protein
MDVPDMLSTRVILKTPLLAYVALRDPKKNLPDVVLTPIGYILNLVGGLSTYDLICPVLHIELAHHVRFMVVEDMPDETDTGKSVTGSITAPAPYPVEAIPDILLIVKDPELLTASLRTLPVGYI